ncbi:MAG: DNA mismatch repair endonuclease MutL [Muribaculaceae bacterium]
MSDIIKLLPDSVANQIAAGEVIQRPASVIKELVENAVDAKATQIQIVLKDAGRTLIQVIDNGIGMSDTDARLAFERHSTSKIRKAEDLFDLHTMGFRGEALASIAAISQVELRTCKQGEEIGTKIEISASTCINQEPDACPPGSNFMIKNIFFNVPARRKFLKTNQVELSNIIKEFEKLALVNHEVEFTLVHNDNTIYKLMPGSFKQRITSLLGKNLDQQLIPLNVDTSLVKIEGFISRPEGARKRNFLQFLFVNGRHMRHPYFHKAIISCYEQLISSDSQPNYFLYFTVDPQSIDVNIHPTKNEIKFENEAPIWQIIAAAVKEALGKFNVVPSIDFDNEDAPTIPIFRDNKNVDVPTIGIDPNYNPFNTGGNSSSSNYGTSASRLNKGSNNQAYSDWQALYDNFNKDKKSEETPSPHDGFEQSFVGSIINQDAAVENTLLNASGRYMQLNGRYIISPNETGLLIVDQHRAHLRILYDNYMSQMSGENVISQRVLFPEIINLSPAQNALMIEIEPDMTKIGFALSQMSGNDWAINGIPQGVGNKDVKDVIFQLLDSIENGGSALQNRVYEHIALSVAQSGAFAYGRKLTDDEMEALVTDLMSRQDPNYTPDGKKIIVNLSYNQINKMF